MQNAQWIEIFRAAGLPHDLTESVEQMLCAADALRPVYPPELLYQINFGERVVLRELIEPDKHESHWWQTGLFFIRQGIAGQPALQQEYGALLDALQLQLISRLGPYEEVSLREITEDTVTGICLLSELLLGYIDHEEGPGEFYRGLGFVETGEIDEGEIIMRLAL